MKPKTLLIDIETFPHHALVWGMYETDVFHLLKPGYHLCAAYKWLGEKKIHTIALPDFKGYNGGDSKERFLVKEVWKRLDEADYVVAQNALRFDVPELNAKFIKYKLPPPSPYQVIDTYVNSKKVARLPSHKLDEKGRYYGYGRKTPHTGKELWLGCDAGDKKSWDLMLKYNMQDIELLEADYRLFAPWVKLPNVNLISDGVSCPKPGCGGKLIRRGEGRNLSSTYPKYSCKKCGGWCRGTNKAAPKVEVRA